MKILKYLNKKLCIVLSVSAVFFFLCSQAYAVTISSNLNPSKTFQSVPFFTSSTIVFGGAGSPETFRLFIDYGDGSPEVLEHTASLGAGTVTVSSNHTYSKPGKYIVRARATIGGSFTLSNPNPATMIQQVGMLNINRIQLYFDNNRPETTIKRNQKTPGLYAKLDYSGSGYFKGYWEVDGVKRGYVFKNLAKGPSVTLKYPSVPPLPTYRFGTHKVRFVVTSPAMSIDFPYGIYFVTSDPAPADPLVIKLLQPAEGESLTYDPIIFRWQPMGKSSLYLLSVFSKIKEERVFSAYTRQGEYKLRSSTLTLYMKQGEEYLWSVKGFNDENEITAESIPASFILNQETASLTE